jgi:RNA polymerase sigma factor (sigma-70 family)
MMNLTQHYRDRRKHLLSVARKNVMDHSPHLAEECVQQAYTNLIKYIDGGNLILNTGYEGLLYKILFNCIHDCNTSERKRGMTGNSKCNAEFDDSTQQEKLIDTIDVGTFEQICLNTLVERYYNREIRQSEILYRYFVLGYSHKEIATTLEISEKTSRNVVYNEVKRIREC